MTSRRNSFSCALLAYSCGWAFEPFKAALDPGARICCKRKAFQCQGTIEVPHCVLGSRRPQLGLLPSFSAAFEKKFFLKVKTLMGFPCPR